MTMLAVFTFRSVNGADGVAELLPSLDAGRPPEHTDVAVVRWDSSSLRPSTRQLSETARTGRVDGTFWGLLFGHALFEPLLRSAVEGAAPAPASPLALVGIDDQFLSEVFDAVAPGTSALGLLTTGGVVDLVASAATDAYTSLIQVHLSREEEHALSRVFGDASVLAERRNQRRRRGV